MIYPSDLNFRKEKKLEEKIKFLEKQIFELKKLISESQNYSEGVQSSLWESEAKQKDKNRDLSNNTNNVSNNLFNYQYSNNANLSDTWTPRIWAANEYTLFNNNLWKCVVANSNPPSDGAEWVKVNLAEMLIDLNKRVTILESEV